MILSFLLSQILLLSLLSLLYQTAATSSSPLPTLCIHLVSLILWSAQFIWCAWMLNCPVLDLGHGFKIVLKKKIKWCRKLPLQIYHICQFDIFSSQKCNLFWSRVYVCLYYPSQSKIIHIICFILSSFFIPFKFKENIEIFFSILLNKLKKWQILLSQCIWFTSNLDYWTEKVLIRPISM